MNKSNCPERGQIAAYVLGAVEQHELEALSGHLSDCPQCQAVADELESSASDRLTDLLRELEPAEDISSDPECQQALARIKQFTDARPQVAGEELSLPCTLEEYVVLERIGGNLSDVYKALHTTMDRFVAVKLLPAQALANEESVRRFHREMKAIGRLEHPNIVRAYDAREIEGKQVLVMELVAGKNLLEIVSARGALTVADACEVARQAAVGLQYVHEKGLVHRDVKPSNLMLTPNGQVKLLDLGLARFHTCQPGVEEMTGAWHMLGTANYMAPEQITSSREVDIRADIYSLGCTLYKLLTGRAPFDGPKYENTSDVLNAHLHEPNPSVKQARPDVPDGLAAVLDRMLAKSPSDRFDTPGQVAAALEPFTAGCDLRALAAGGGRRPPDSWTTHQPCQEAFPWLWVLTVAAVLLILVILGLGQFGLHRTDVASESTAIGPQTPPEKPQQESPPVSISDTERRSQPETARATDEPQPEPSAPRADATASDTVATPPSDSGRTDSQVPAGQASPSTPASSDSVGPPVDVSDSVTPTGTPPGGTPHGLAEARDERAAFVVSLDVDHADRIYYGPPAGPDGKGEVMHATVESSKPGYLYLMYVTADGQHKCLFPNQVQRDNKIAAGQKIVVPHPDAEFRFRAGPPYGKELLKAVVTFVPLEPERFGVASLTAADVTPVEPAAVKNMFVELNDNPVNLGEREVEITTMPGRQR